MQDQNLNQNFEDKLNDDEEENVISKSQIKREMTALQELGKKLIDLKDNQIAKMPVSDELLRAIKESKNITQREATRRHLQFIGKLMRDQDADAIQYALDEFDSSSQRFTQATHELEVWRKRLIEKSNAVVTEYVEKYPKTNVQYLRQLVRNAVKDHKNDKNTGAAKKLFQYLKDNSKSHEA
jgi:ribosome-associated protein|tara:strand:- start:565 stop:1110 length:546 start_codon:yes stop_codon:yes gene_type:complete